MVEDVHETVDEPQGDCGVKGQIARMRKNIKEFENLFAEMHEGVERRPALQKRWRRSKVCKLECARPGRWGRGWKRKPSLGRGSRKLNAWHAAGLKNHCNCTMIWKSACRLPLITLVLNAAEWAREEFARIN